MSDSVYRPMVWSTLQAQGVAIIKSISEDRNELQKVFGENYQGLTDHIDGRRSKTGASKTASKPTMSATASTNALSHPPVIPPTSTTSGQANKRPAPSDASSATQTANKPKRAKLAFSEDIIDLSSE
jgi:hypothetical protein